MSIYLAGDDSQVSPSRSPPSLAGTPIFYNHGDGDSIPRPAYQIRPPASALADSPPHTAPDSPRPSPGSVSKFTGISVLPIEPVTSCEASNAAGGLNIDSVPTVPQCRINICSSLSSQFKSEKDASNGKRDGHSSSRHYDHDGAGSCGSNGNIAQSSARRSQIGNANHLLNFHYDPIIRFHPRNPLPKRQQKSKPYNKDLFLQANFKFFVLDTGDCQTESMDPDKMFQWEDIVCVNYSSSFPIHCPICLETLLSPQLTSCGHIYCFPCILHYVLMGEDDLNSECSNKCPLCSTMVSLKDLRSVHIEYVKQFHVGDRLSFVLLSRQKDSLVPSLKNQQTTCHMLGTRGDFLPFSKYIFTSDVELSAREARVDLRDWLHKAEEGLVDDLEKMPYVHAALEQLEERMKYWKEHQTSSGTLSIDCHDFSSKSKGKYIPNREHLNFPKDSKCVVSDAWDSVDGTIQIGPEHEPTTSTGEIGVKFFPITVGAAVESCGGLEEHSCSPNADDVSPNNLNKRDSYTFYQAIDGQHLILHPLNMKCLLHHYGSYDLLPPRIDGVVLELETVTQSEAMRKRYRYLSHFSLTTTFQICEIDMAGILPPRSLILFLDELKKREKQRKKLAKREQIEKTKSEAANFHESHISNEQRHLYSEDAMFSLDDFKALGTGAPPSTSPSMASERKLFSSVTRLGFAAAHDSPPALRGEDSAVTPNGADTMGETATRDARITPKASFASIISTSKIQERPGTQHSSGIGKKGKKPTRILLSTAGGRRY